MSEMSGQCEDESCLNQSHKIIRVFPCLYHCKKMLCIQHLSEHDKFIEKQLQYQNQLEDLWKNYRITFNEEKIEEKYLKLKLKLENFRQLRSKIEPLLSVKRYHDSVENNQKLQIAIQMIQNEIEQENQSESIIKNVQPKIEYDDNDSRPMIDFGSLSSSDVSNGSETGNSSPSFSNTNGNLPPIAQEDEFDEHENNVESENDDPTMDETKFKDANNHENNVTPFRGIRASKLRDYCPLTHDGAFGINSQIHGIRLCPQKPLEFQRTYRVNEHFRRCHHLTASASLALARAMGTGQDPKTTRLFYNHDMILDIDEIRTINCPITQPFVHHSSLQIENSPCNTIKQVRHLRDHLKRSHKFTNRAANMIVKAIKNDIPVHMIEFPEWINIIENSNQF